MLVNPPFEKCPQVCLGLDGGRVHVYDIRSSSSNIVSSSNSCDLSSRGPVASQQLPHRSPVHTVIPLPTCSSAAGETLRCICANLGGAWLVQARARVSGSTVVAAADVVCISAQPPGGVGNTCESVTWLPPAARSAGSHDCTAASVVVSWRSPPLQSPLSPLPMAHPRTASSVSSVIGPPTQPPTPRCARHVVYRFMSSGSTVAHHQLAPAPSALPCGGHLVSLIQPQLQHLSECTGTRACKPAQDQRSLKQLGSEDE